MLRNQSQWTAFPPSLHLIEIKTNIALFIFFLLFAFLAHKLLYSYMDFAMKQKDRFNSTGERRFNE